MRGMEEWGSQAENISRDVIQEALPCVEKGKAETNDEATVAVTPQIYR